MRALKTKGLSNLVRPLQGVPSNGNAVVVAYSRIGGDLQQVVSIFHRTNSQQTTRSATDFSRSGANGDFGTSFWATSRAVKVIAITLTGNFV